LLILPFCTAIKPLERNSILKHENPSTKYISLLRFPVLYEGMLVGTTLGTELGRKLGVSVGATDGREDGLLDGGTLGIILGNMLGKVLRKRDGGTLRCLLGTREGESLSHPLVTGTLICTSKVEGVALPVPFNCMIFNVLCVIAASA
jgi:hypothetical protein